MGLQRIASGFEVQKGDLDRVQEGLDRGFGQVVGILWEGLDDGVDVRGDFVIMPDGVDHVKDVVSDHGGEAMDREEKVRAGGVEPSYIESYGRRGPNLALK